jgi:hypothetical protein
LVDVEEVFRAASPSGVPGHELFHEHVHMNFHGDYLLAGSLCEQVIRLAGMAQVSTRIFKQVYIF